jgi:hypothetical protein
LNSTITRNQAAQVAADILRSKSEASTHKVHRVVTLDEISWQRPMPAYGVSKTIFDGNWIVYLADKSFVGLKSSIIMVLEQETGRLLYFGSAHDEG